MEVLWMVCERKECAEECLYQTPVIEVLLAPVAAQLSRPQVSLIYSLFLIWFLFFFYFTAWQWPNSEYNSGRFTKSTRDTFCLNWTVLLWNQSPPGFPFWNQPLIVYSFFCGFQAKFKPPAASLTLIADVLARIANADGGLALFLQEKNVVAAHGERWGGVTKLIASTASHFMAMHKL